MKNFRRFLSVILALGLVLAALSSCMGGNDVPEQTTDASGGDGTTTGAVGQETTTEPAATLPVPTYATLEEALGREAVASHIGGSGAMLLRYEKCKEAEFYAACEFYESWGYTLYCTDGMKLTKSATYVKDNAYCALFLDIERRHLYTTVSEKGGRALPEYDENYEKLYDVTLTAPKTEQQGLCDIFRLEDGSFMLLDSANKGAHHTIFETLCQLNGGSAEGLHIRAWVLTHTHGDHYGGFLNFAETYADRVQLDTVLYAPVNRAVIDTIDGYKPILGNTWDTIDYFFNDGLSDLLKEYFPDTDLCTVHAGQMFHFAGLDLHILYSPEHVYIDGIPVNMNVGSIACMVRDKNGAALLMGDNEGEGTQWVMKIYGDELVSNIHQIPHHGMSKKQDVNLAKFAKASIILIPCTQAYFNKNCSKYTREIMGLPETKATYVMGDGTVTLLLSGQLSQ